jgi:hypothetical protein
MRTDSDFLPGYQRKALNDKFLSLVGFNISLNEINSDQKIQQELASRGIVCWEALQSQHPEKKSVKFHFNDREKTILFLKNFYVSDFKTFDNKKEQITIRIEPDIPSPLQCHKCQLLGHVKEKCQAQELCGQCLATDHVTKECTITDKTLHKCAQCESISGHGSIDRKCPKYRKIKRDAANDAVDLITNSRQNRSKKKIKDNEFGDRQTLGGNGGPSYAEITQNMLEVASLSKQVKEIQSKPVTNDGNISQMSNDVKSLIITNKNQAEELKVLKKEAAFDRNKLTQGMTSLELAIEAMTNLGTKFDNTTNKLDERITNIVRNECETVRNEFTTTTNSMKSEYSSFYSNHETRLAALESLARGAVAQQTTSSILQPSKLAPNNFQQTAPLQLHLQQHQHQPTQQHHHQVSNILAENNNFLNRIQTPNGLYYNQHYENNNAFSSSNAQSMKYN